MPTGKHSTCELQWHLVISSPHILVLSSDVRGVSTCNVSAGANTTQRSHQLRRQRRRNTIVLASMVIIFTVTWLPFNAFNMLLDIYPNATLTAVPNKDITYTISIITQVGVAIFFSRLILTFPAQTIAMLNNVANPILYAFLNPQFSAQIRRLRICLCVTNISHRLGKLCQLLHLSNNDEAKTHQ